MRTFAYQWAARTWSTRVANYTGRSVPYCASTQFEGAGVRPGDLLYVLAIAPAREELLLIGRFEVASRFEVLTDGDRAQALLSHEEAKAALGIQVYGVPLFGGPEDAYVIPRKGTASTMRFDRSVPQSDRLRFETRQGPRYLRYDRDSKIDRQAVRSLSRLASNSARALDALLEADSR